MDAARLEVLVEPFKENDPGPHVDAVLRVLRDERFSVDMGPFSTIAVGELTDLVGILEALYIAGFDAGASSIQTRLERQ